jgi:hypothetical protein
MKRHVEPLVLVLRRLVDRHDDRLAGPTSLTSLSKRDQRRRVVRSEARGWLVQEHDHWVRDQLQRDVHALPLAPGEHLLLRLSDLQVRHALEAQVPTASASTLPRRSPPPSSRRAAGTAPSTSPPRTPSAPGARGRPAARSRWSRGARRRSRRGPRPLTRTMAPRRREVAVQRHQQRGLARAGLGPMSAIMSPGRALKDTRSRRTFIWPFWSRSGTSR